MIEWVEGDDIFAIEANVYVITVNCVGVMGTGVAEAFRDRERALYRQYRKDCKDGVIRIGRGVVYDKEPRLQYVMFPTKQNWRNKSRYDYIEQGLDWFFGEGIADIHPDAHIVMSPLGCGNGGLSFEMVSLMIAQAMEGNYHRLTVVYPWYQKPHHSLVKA